MNSYIEVFWVEQIGKESPGTKNQVLQTKFDFVHIAQMQRTCGNLQQLFRKYDLPSMREMIMNHINALNRRECKYMRTTDLSTLKIAQQIVSSNQFLRQNILGIPDQSTQQTQSLVIKVCNINRHQREKEQYREWKKVGRDRLVAVGGPAATDQTLMSCMIPAIHHTHDIHYYCRRYLQSNILHSASQSHARHGNALNADPVLSGRHLLPLVFKRKLFNTSLSSVLQSDYIKVDVKFPKPKYLSQYVRNQINGIVQNIKSFLAIRNQHDLNRLESIASQEIQKVMQSKLGFTIRSNNRLAENEHSMAIHLIFTQNSLKEVKNQQAHFLCVKQLKWAQLSRSEILKYFPHSQGILTAFRYYGDYSNRFDMYKVSKLKCIELGARWEESKTVSQIYVDFNQKKEPIVCGISFSDGQFVPSNKIHLTLGYKAKYVFQNWHIQPLTSFNIPSTGVSMTIIIQKSQRIRQIIKEKGRAMELALINSHWTIIEQNQDYILMRATAGGNTGSEEYMPEYFLNLCANTRRIFGDSFVGIVSSYGCPRAVNFKNSTQFNQLAKGLVISYGKGGTGNTKRSSQAYKALKYLGLDGYLKQYFRQIPQERLKICDTMDEICRQSQKVDLYYNNYQATTQFLGS